MRRSLAQRQLFGRKRLVKSSFGCQLFSINPASLEVFDRAHPVALALPADSFSRGGRRIERLQVCPDLSD